MDLPSRVKFYVHLSSHTWNPTGLPLSPHQDKLRIRYIGIQVRDLHVQLGTVGIVFCFFHEYFYNTCVTLHLRI